MSNMHINELILEIQALKTTEQDDFYPKAMRDVNLDSLTRLLEEMPDCGHLSCLGMNVATIGLSITGAVLNPTIWLDRAVLECFSRFLGRINSELISEDIERMLNGNS